MKEVKFRAWDKRAEKMIYKHHYISFEGELYPYNKNLVLMQDTGLKDKNGTKIYGGDIVNWDKWDGHNLKKEKFEIVWITEEAGFYGIGINDKTRIISLINSRVGLEVIGNIYENPELLE